MLLSIFGCAGEGAVTVSIYVSLTRRQTLFLHMLLRQDTFRTVDRETIRDSVSGMVSLTE